MRILRTLLVLLAVGILGAAPPAAQVTIKLIAINDFHGYIEPSETFALPDPADPPKTVREPVGGAAYLATATPDSRPRIGATWWSARATWSARAARLRALPRRATIQALSTWAWNTPRSASRVR